MSSRRHSSFPAVDRLTEASWLLPAVLPRYRAPLSLDRPEMRAAYEHGVADRAADTAPPAHILESGDLPVAPAYAAGRRPAAFAPKPWPLAAAMIAWQVVGQAAWDATRGHPARPLLLGVAGGATALAAHVTRDVECRRATRLGLTPLTAPRPAFAGSMLIMVPLGVVRAILNIRHRRATGRWPRRAGDWPSKLAIDVVTAVLRRRAWRRAVDEARARAATDA